MSKLSRGVPHVVRANRTVRTPITLTPRPAFTISMLVTWPYVKTIALGGLDTGSRKEKDTHRAVGISMYRGFTPIASANGASIGKKIVIVAALLATSVIEVTIRQAMVTVAKGWRFPKGVSSSATQDDKPEVCWVKNRRN